MHARSVPERAAVTSHEPDTSSLLARVELPSPPTETLLASGRRCEIDSDGEIDRITVRARDGCVLLRVVITDAGPLLSFSSAEVELSASRRLTLEAREIEVRAGGDLRVDVAGSMRERISGDHHTRVGGTEQLEANALELQASGGAVAVRAMEAITLDGEHIGLNDDPCPSAFPWSAIADGPDPAPEGSGDG